MQAKLKSFLLKTVLWGSIFIVFVLVMDKIVMPFYVKLGNEKKLPGVLEYNVNEAINLLENNGFSVIIQDSMYDARYDAGTVIDQNPYPGATVKSGRRVYLTVSVGEKPIIMPKLFGLSPRDAELTLRAYNLELDHRYYNFSDDFPEGIVISQSFPQGQKVAPGTKIDITISLGKMKEEITVPELVGKSLYEARQRLRLLHIRIGKISYEERDNILPETVLSQSIPAGSIPSPSERIDLVVSKEPQNRDL